MPEAPKMANDIGVKISELPLIASLSGKEIFPVVVEKPGGEKETSGAPVGLIAELVPAGESGASAFDIWAKAQPEGSDLTEEAFLAYMAGKTGNDGVDGLSAYEIWVAAQPENADTSEEAFIEFQKGKDGADGLSAYQIWVSQQEEGVDISEDAYLKFQMGKSGKDGEAGLSAYQIWLEAGHEGTEEDFLEWLKVSASVDIDPQATNIITNDSDGLYVNGAHPVIPKMVSTTLNDVLVNYKSLADGTRIYTLTAILQNPLEISALGGVGIYRYTVLEPKYFFTNDNGEYIPTQYFITEIETSPTLFEITIAVIMQDEPKKSWNLSTLEEVEGPESAGLQCKVLILMLAGTTLRQNGMN
jgi:hypothetical protein